MIPEKTEKDVAEMTKKLDKLNSEKEREEIKLAEVMESLKTETQGLQAEKEAKEQELLELEKIENATKSKYQVTKSEHELYLRNQNAEMSKLRETERNFDRASKTLKERKTYVENYIVLIFIVNFCLGPMGHITFVGNHCSHVFQCYQRYRKESTRSAS